MSLQFATFETIVLAMSVMVVNCLVRKGQTNDFEGLLLKNTQVFPVLLRPMHNLTDLSRPGTVP